MKKSSFLIAGKHAVTEALKNPERKVFKVFLNFECLIFFINVSSLSS
jgi:23S rRNA (guanosine2251-2'-O)-methyltransferase